VIAALRPLGEPFAILEAGRIIAVSPPAYDEGVRIGQRRKEAESRCDWLVVLARDVTNEVRTFDAVVGALEGFGVDVALRAPGWAGCMTRGPTRRLGGEAALSEAVTAAVRAVLVAPPFGLRDQKSPGLRLLEGACSVGIGDGPFVATLAAASKLVVRHEDTLDFLRDQPIEVLEQPKLTEVLRRLGISTLGAFAALPVADVLARFGVEGARFHERARGAETSSPIGRNATPTYIREVSFDPPAEAIDSLTFSARQIAEELCVALSDDGRSCSLLWCEVVMSEGDHLSRRWSHDGPWSAPLILERLRWQLEAWVSAPHAVLAGDSGIPRGIERLTLVAEEVRPSTARQVGMWGHSPNDVERVERVLARVQGMLGPEAVQRAFLVGGRGPYERVRLVPFGEPPPLEQGLADLPWPGRLPAPNPALLFIPPRAVEVITESGSPFTIDGRGTPNGAPVTLVVGGDRFVVTAWAGPWPVDEQWWRQGSHRRRARLQIVTSGGVAYLLAQEHGRWFAEGRYD
jgi:protein ImuB